MHSLDPDQRPRPPSGKPFAAWRHSGCGKTPDACHASIFAACSRHLHDRAPAVAGRPAFADGAARRSRHPGGGVGDPRHTAHHRLCGSSRRQRPVSACGHEPWRFPQPAGTQFLSAGRIPGCGDVVCTERLHGRCALGSDMARQALDDPERGIFPSFYSKIGSCDNPNFHDAGLAVALLDKWIIDYMTDQKLIVPDKTIVVGQSAGGWARDRAVEPECTGGTGYHHLCGGPRRTRRRQAKQQLRAGQARRGDARFRTHRARADAVDLHRERHVFRPGLIEANARRPIPRPAVTPNITCFLRSAMTGIF